MLDRILVPLDGSRFAEAAAPLAFSLAERTGGKLHLVHVLEVPSLALGGLPRDSATGEEYLRSVADRWDVGRRIPVSYSVRDGVVAEALGGAAAEWRADVVVMSTHGRSGVSRFWMGSVADRFVRSSVHPVLLVHPSERAEAVQRPAPVERIVIAMDGSERAESGLPWAEALARAFGVPLLLLQALTYPGAPQLDTPAQGEIVAAAESESLAYLNQQCLEVQGHGTRASVRVVRAPSAAQLVLQEAGSDPIVLTTRGHGGVVRAALGSVTDKVVRGAHGPVLVVPG